MKSIYYMDFCRNGIISNAILILKYLYNYNRNTFIVLKQNSNHQSLNFGAINTNLISPVRGEDRSIYCMYIFISNIYFVYIERVFVK